MMMMMMIIMMMALLDITNYAWMLPPPSHVFMESVDMRHVLRWSPPQAPCNTTVLYSVQFQGEFELTILNDSWVNAAECRLTPDTECDLTFDLGSDSDYNLRIKAQCESQTSPWTNLNCLFNRKHTILTAPKMAVTTVGDALQVSVDELPATAAATVRVWKKGHELQTSVYMMPAEEEQLHVAALQEGSVYCVSAQTVLDTHHHSSSTDTQCVSIRGPDTVWKRMTTPTVIIFIMAGFLLAVFWSIIHRHSEFCQKYFHKEPPPRSLQFDWNIQIPGSRKEAELCELVSVV
ncbi:interleukin-20 receptor subunit beta [Brachionichthys hirsutus]|uniref:interleukin-20 receptor subunit beta n=1 Tax=Brachionichthys hirsutus TaxID=412623 RepID=UPI003604A1F8